MRLTGLFEMNAARTSIQRVVLFSSSGTIPYRFVFEVAMVQNCHFFRTSQTGGAVAIKQQGMCHCSRELLRVRSASVSLTRAAVTSSQWKAAAPIIDRDCRRVFTNGSFMPTTLRYEIWLHSALHSLKKVHIPAHLIGTQPRCKITAIKIPFSHRKV